MKALAINLSEYTVDTEPDTASIGKKVDNLLLENFQGKQVVVRGIASSEHPDKPIDELIDIITTTGTDRYDPDRPGDRYENIDSKHIDFFGVPATLKPGAKVFEHIVYGFYHSAIGVHGKPQRIDIVSVYDADQLHQVVHRYEGRDDIKEDGFAFKDPEHKTEALLGVIKIT